MGKAEARAVFLDRDGTINEDVGCLCSVEELVFTPNAFHALRILQERFLLFIITNQPWISGGAFSEKQFFLFTDDYNSILESENIHISGTFFCPHVKDDKCGCRKPSDYFIQRILKDHPVNPGSSFAIGDHPHDVEMGKKAGTKTAFLLSGHGRRHVHELEEPPDFIAENLYQAALLITGEKELP